ncbi:TolC family outer membrane protein [Novosphingobium sp. KCTC 2891]|uniref:TolC family outer membrane protein n=1 Tax=Novosphingobium sp. KCTC 2891 TaxID=2989730 RepID=UPI002222F915|nr:TolC family outer membrane protein [Novosphingobium sp. KCTC 2891]MCW1382207.1 TolC family outer membrane protein [Novosphingobium sp. KCTC 2891]
MRQGRLRAVLLAGAMAAFATPALADDLRGALVAAYQTNPDLQAARANQRATDEGVPIARSAALPSLSGTASYSEFVKKTANSFLAPDRAFSSDVSLSVPVYAGGAVKNSIRAAKTRVVAGQADLRGIESGVFAQAVAAYMDVIRDQAIVGLNRNNVDVLQVNLKATSDRYEIGDVTRTDVAQSNSRLALARGDLRTAEANLVASRERYIQIVGKAPVDLQPPPPLAGLPPAPDDAVDIALDSNPDLAAARERSKAARYDSKVAGAGRLPRVSIFTSGNYTDYLGTLGSAGSVRTSQNQTTAQAGVSASIPLFQGGLPAARERQAQAVEGATLEREISIERDVVATVRSAYTSWKAANDVIAMNQTAVDAAALSLEGVRAENTVGNRTILNILDAEQELLRAQVQLVAARRNAYVAGFNLLAAMGKAQAKDLALDAGPESAVLYDPQVNYDRVKGKIWDWAKDPAPKPVSTRTVDTPAQDATIAPQPAP